MEISPARCSNKQSSLRLSRLHGQFKSPVLAREDKADTSENKQNSLNLTEELDSNQLLKSLDDVKQSCAKMEAEIEDLTIQGIKESELDEHIAKLHEYNEIKDATQMVLGQLAVLEGVTVAELHQRFNLDLKE